MKFGQEYQKALASEDFPEHWRESAIEYKHLKKCFKKINEELKSIGLDARTLSHLSGWVDPDAVDAIGSQDHGRGHESRAYYSAAEPTLSPVPEEFTPQLRVLVDGKTGIPLDATLAAETKESLRKLARHEIVTAGRRDHLGGSVQPPTAKPRNPSVVSEISSLISTEQGARWVQIPLATAKDFFDLLEPKMRELEALRMAETEKLEEEIMDLGDAVEDVVEPVREGFEAVRSVSYRDLYFWREMFRLYLQKPIFYSETRAGRGALTFDEAHRRLQEYDDQLRSTGLLAKLKTPQAKQAAKQFLDLNVDILKIMHFQEMNSRAMTKILKKFDKRTHLEGQTFMKDLNAKYPALLTNGRSSQSVGGFADSIARDLQAELASKVLAIVPQLEDWKCPVCYSMAWRPVNLGCCRSIICISCIIHLQEERLKRCPVCNEETVMRANGKNIDFDSMDFLEKYFPLEAKRRQKENEQASLLREFGEEYVKPSCCLQ